MRKLMSVSIKFIVPVAILVTWFVVTHFKLVRPVIIPPLPDVWKACVAMADLLPAAIIATVGMTLTGFGLGTILGTAAGLVMAYSRLLREMFGHVFDFLRPVPVFALLPLFILWFGIGQLPKIALITLGTSVILGVTTLEAIRNVPPIYVRAALTLGASRHHIYRTVIVPYILPHLIGSIRVAAAAAWGLNVAAELMGSQQGLGYLIVQQQIQLRTHGIIFLVLVYSILAIVLDLVVGIIEAWLTRWTERRAVHGAAGAVIGAR